MAALVTSTFACATGTAVAGDVPPTEIAPGPVEAAPPTVPPPPAAAEKPQPPASEAPAQRADPSAPEIVPRAAWKAKPADEKLMRKQQVRAIIIHHTSAKQNRKLTLETKLRNLQSFSMTPNTIEETGRKKPAWGDVPYHYYIDAAGRTGEARSIEFAGDTNTGYKTDGYIQIVLEGHFDTETPDPAQLAALDKLVLWLTATHKIPAKEITGHNDHAPSDCPGKKLKAYLDTLRKKVERAQSAK